MKWNGAVVLITGASRGIGREIAVAAAKRGARVGLMARSKDELREVLDACGGKGAIAVGDVAERLQVEGGLDALQRELGPVDVRVDYACIEASGAAPET